jgi:SAM-dependent methyltransferase
MSKSGNYWERMSKQITDPSQTYNKRPDISFKDADFIKKYVTKDHEVIDIGSGTGQVTNKILPFVKNIIAVETFEGLSKYITEDPNLMVINAKLEGFCIRKEFDIAIATGVMQCFPTEEVVDLYSNIYKMVKKDGLLIMRIHCGLNETIVINKSEELGIEYFAEYRQVDEEKERILNAGFSEVNVLDEAPEELNVWENTRHFMFVCKK